MRIIDNLVIKVDITEQIKNISTCRHGHKINTILCALIPKIKLGCWLML